MIKKFNDFITESNSTNSILKARKTFNDVEFDYFDYNTTDELLKSIYDKFGENEIQETNVDFSFSLLPLSESFEKFYKAKPILLELEKESETEDDLIIKLIKDYNNDITLDYISDIDDNLLTSKLEDNINKSRFNNNDKFICIDESGILTTSNDIQELISFEDMELVFDNLLIS